MSDTENTEKFKVGDRVRSIVSEPCLPIGFEAVLKANSFWTSGFSIIDDEGDERAFFPDKWKLVSNVAPKEVEWGPAIEVDGKRPEWLDGYEGKLWWFNDDQRNGIQMDNCASLNWGPYLGHDFGEVKSIRLPANHPHYATPTRTALEQRMEVAIRRHVAGKPYLFDDDEGPNISIEAEFRAIVQELEPVDPEYERAEKEITELWYDENRFEAVVKFAVEQVARGRALERGE